MKRWWIQQYSREPNFSFFMYIHKYQPGQSNSEVILSVVHTIAYCVYFPFLVFQAPNSSAPVISPCLTLQRTFGEPGDVDLFTTSSSVPSDSKQLFHCSRSVCPIESLLPEHIGFALVIYLRIWYLILPCLAETMNMSKAFSSTRCEPNSTHVGLLLISRWLPFCSALVFLFRCSLKQSLTIAPPCHQKSTDSMKWAL